MSTLYALTQEMQVLDDMVAQSDGLLTPELEAELERIEFETLEKVDAYYCLIREVQARADRRKAEAERLADLGRSDEKFVARLKRRIFEHMQAAKVKRYDTAHGRFSRCTNGGVLGIKLRNEDYEQWPSWAQRVDIRPNTEAIRERLNAGEDLPFAQFAERGETLRVM